jgi:hypothetical protein
VETWGAAAVLGDGSPALRAAAKLQAIASYTSGGQDIGVILLADIPTTNTRLVWLGVAFAGATILYAVLRGARGKKDPLARGTSSSSLARQRNVERQMESLLVELSEMARQITAQLDTRSAKLEALIREADEKISALRQSPQVPTATTAAAPEWTAASIDPQHEAVYALADQGKSTGEIARQLNRPNGEVELILALRARV